MSYCKGSARHHSALSTAWCSCGDHSLTRSHTVWFSTPPTHLSLLATHQHDVDISMSQKMDTPGSDIFFVLSFEMIPHASLVYIYIFPLLMLLQLQQHIPR
ncbi:hypothetical protein MN608_02832 [Microdochium nivale]|nr:hypothetical protein MN608_02832 [Microdochium nivale]